MKTWNFWFGTIGVLGVLWSVYTYFDQRKVGLLSYQTQTQKIFDPADLKNFKLVAENGLAIEKRIYATELVFWNSGNLNLGTNSDRVREPLKITLLDDQQFFYFVENKSFPSNNNFSFTLQPDKKTYLIQWKFLDPGDGARLTFIHSGEATTRVEVQGKFFETSLRNEFLITPSALRTSWIISLIFFVLAGGLTVVMVQAIRAPRRDWGDILFPAFMLLTLSPLGLASFYSSIVSHVPPF